MRRWIGGLLSGDDGQDLAEYGIALAVVVPAVAFIAVFIGTDIGTLWQRATDAIAQALSP
jgi:Flp pilus assembly pilin Flp